MKLRVTVPVVLLALATAACGALSDKKLVVVYSPAPEATASPSPGASMPVPILIKDGKVQTATEELILKVGESITFEVTSDQTDTLHVSVYDMKLPVRTGGAIIRVPLKMQKAGVYDVRLLDENLHVMTLRVSD